MNDRLPPRERKLLADYCFPHADVYRWVPEDDAQTFRWLAIKTARLIQDTAGEAFKVYYPTEREPLTHAWRLTQCLARNDAISLEWLCYELLARSGKVPMPEWVKGKGPE